MRKNFPKILFAVFSISLLVYIALPEPSFPDALWDFKVSTQPADQETLLRRGYYTNITREQLMSHYKREFKWGVGLNYPPEEGQTLIRDQTKSSFLEEIVHPMRESLFVNGYRPTSDKEILEADGVIYEQKVIVKYVGSNVVLRLAVGLATLAALWLLLSEWFSALKTLKWIYR